MSICLRVDLKISGDDQTSEENKNVKTNCTKYEIDHIGNG